VDGTRSAPLLELAFSRSGVFSVHRPPSVPEPTPPRATAGSPESLVAPAGSAG
jgi:hypothetical protein